MPQQYCLNAVQREKSTDKVTEVMSSLLYKSDGYLGRRLVDLEIAEELISFVFAGSGTTANTLVFLIWSVLRNPEIHRKLKQELREAFPDPSTIPTISVASKLKYTNAIISESLRRFPTIPGTQPRTVVVDNLTLDGFEIPKGVCISFIAVDRNI